MTKVVVNQLSCQKNLEKIKILLLNRYLYYYFMFNSTYVLNKILIIAAKGLKKNQYTYIQFSVGYKTDLQKTLLVISTTSNSERQEEAFPINRLDELEIIKITYLKTLQM